MRAARERKKKLVRGGEDWWHGREGGNKRERGGKKKRGAGQLGTAPQKPLVTWHTCHGTKRVTWYIIFFKKKLG
jgi:hypothetical protein